MHCKRAARVISAGMHSHCTACASTARSADVPACPATSAQRPKLSKSFSQAGHVDVQRVVDGEVDLRRTSTSELACDAGTSGTLSAGDLSWCCELAHLLFSWCAAESLRELQILRPLYLSCSHFVDQPRAKTQRSPLGSFSGRWRFEARDEVSVLSRSSR